MGLDADYPIRGHGVIGEVFGSDERGVLTFKIGFGDLTGLPATPSDVDRHTMLDYLWPQLA